jgi:hypothetical protein
MINSKRIIELSKLSGMRPWQQEKHYVQSLILTIVSDYPLVFKGGTYLWIFHGLNRFSEDLDFTAAAPIKKTLPEFVSRSLNLYGYENEFKIMKDNNLGLSARFMINGPLNTTEKDRCIVYVEISSREDIILPKISLMADFPQYDIPVKVVQGMNLDEVGAEKIRAILTREKARDVNDLYYLIYKKKIKFDQVLVNKKLDYYHTHFDFDEFMKRLDQTGKTYKRELKQIILGVLPDFDDVQKCISKWLEEA